MVVADIGFYNVIGEYITRSYLVEQMIGYYNLKLGEGETRVTDFNEGSEIRNLLEAIAVDMYILMEQVNRAGEICFIHTAQGFWLDKHGANPFIKLPRIEGKESTGVVTFSMPEEQQTTTTIPGGTILISSSTGLEFLTDADCTIEVGGTSANVNATSATVGFDTNIPADDLTIILDPTFPSGLTVTNNEEFTGGLDFEDDDVYRERLLDYVRADDFGSVNYYKQLAENIMGIHDATLIDDPIYTKKVLINGYEKPTPNSILLEGLVVFTDPDNKVLGHTFIVDKPVYYDLDLTVNLDVLNEYATEELTNILETYINGGESNYIIEFDGFNIGQGITHSDFEEMFKLIDGVVNIEVIDNTTGLRLEDISLNEDEALKLEAVSFNQTIVGE